MSTRTIYCIIYVSGVFVSAIAQILLKKSAGKKYENKIKEYANPYVIISYTIFIAATFCTIYAFKEVPLSFAPILSSSEYVFIAVLSRVFLKERFGVRKLISISLIICGIVVYSL